MRTVRFRTTSISSGTWWTPAGRCGPRIPTVEAIPGRIGKPVRDYTAFVHVLDAQNQIVAQEDSPPRQGSYPTSLWDAGEVVDDPHPLSFGSALGQQLEIGLYTVPDLRRLPTESGGDRV